VLHDDWDLMIGHPDCTYMTNSGVCWLHTKSGRWTSLKIACDFFKLLKNAPIEHICLENPIPHKYARKEIGDYTQIIQPYQFGHAERKATCLWLKNLPKLKPTKNMFEEMSSLPKSQAQRIHYASPSPDRWKVRSRTFTGIAEAMARQWSDYLLENKS
jgi:hypothetical protein